MALDLIFHDCTELHFNCISSLTICRILTFFVAHYVPLLHEKEPFTTAEHHGSYDFRAARHM